MSKRVLLIIGVFVVGMIGGIFAEQIIWPYFVERPLFYQYELEQTPVYITERKAVTIQENTALREAIGDVEKAVIAVSAITESEEVVEGSAIIVTSDGLIVTLAELVPRGSAFSFFIDGKKADYQILKRDLENNLALVKLGNENLPTVAFASLEKIKSGERVFLVGMEFIDDVPGLVVNEGIIKSISDAFIVTNISENITAAGSPLFNIEGEVIGLNTVEEGSVKSIPVSKIRTFIGM